MSFAARDRPDARMSAFSGRLHMQQVEEHTWEDNSAMEDGYEVWVDYWYASCGGDSGMYGDTQLLARRPANSTSASSARIPRPSYFPCGASVSVWVFAMKDGLRSGQSEV